MTVEPMPSPMVERQVEQLEEDERLDSLVGTLGQAARAILPSGRLLEELRGRSVGHALHPFLTDVPIGLWTSAMLLDLTGPHQHAVAARRLVGAGVLMVVPTALSGLADWSGLSSAESRRIGTVHAALNVVAGTLYGSSWLFRRAGRTTAGVVTGLLGGAVVSASGYLGGHPTLARGEPGASARSSGSGEEDWPDEG